ncbi:hypothetical protein QJS04_geneDACA022090 [Acorus gramineus]|uniref:Uncharacterized protein n=1 Tax=Acorus gramineus TaxID=55184 RepID=A0AAV9B030_ACOGR|nr:hypothetical protein QJS04_geneDACA022090 [Acorus gramineus]
MERIMKDLREGRRRTAMDDKEDRVYEDIDAPKFVDFTVPDRAPPDDGSWFCVRIGCDQKHEQVDPDELYRNFVLRVMEARSPNVQLQKALKRRALKPTMKCPLSAPAKSAKERITRMSKPAPDPKTMTMTPKQAKAKKSLVAEKAYTTPRNRRCPLNQEPFRSVRKGSADPGVIKENTAAKALDFDTPRKTKGNSMSSNCSAPLKDICNEVKKLKIGSQARDAKSSRSAANDPKCSAPVSLGSKSSLRAQKLQNTERMTLSGGPDCENGEGMDYGSNEVMEIDESSDVSRKSMHSGSTTTNGVDEPEPSERLSLVEENYESLVVDDKGNDSPLKQLGEKNVEQKGSVFETVEEAQDQTTSVEVRNENFPCLENACHSNDDDKENALSSHDIRDTSIKTNESKENHSQHECGEILQKVKGSCVKTTGSQGLKYKKMKPTNPKPFRFRTDERGILKEANLERRLNLDTHQKTTEMAVKLPNGSTLLKPQKSKTQQQMRSHSVREGKTQTCRITTTRRQKLENIKEEEETQTLQTNTVKPASSPEKSVRAQSATATTKSLKEVSTEPNKTPFSDAPPSHSSAAAGTRQRKKWFATIPKEPNFHKIHIPRSCCTRNMENANI